jgi:hypothetical protein
MLKKLKAIDQPALKAAPRLLALFETLRKMTMAESRTAQRHRILIFSPTTMPRKPPNAAHRLRSIVADVSKLQAQVLRLKRSLQDHLKAQARPIAEGVEQAPVRECWRRCQTLCANVRKESGKSDWTYQQIHGLLQERGVKVPARLETFAHYVRMGRKYQAEQ